MPLYDEACIWLENTILNDRNPITMSKLCVQQLSSSVQTTHGYSESCTLVWLSHEWEMTNGSCDRWQGGELLFPPTRSIWSWSPQWWAATSSARSTPTLATALSAALSKRLITFPSGPVAKLTCSLQTKACLVLLYHTILHSKDPGDCAVVLYERFCYQCNTADIHMAAITCKACSIVMICSTEQQCINGYDGQPEAST